jgi:hypothetical protein
MKQKYVQPARPQRLSYLLAKLDQYSVGRFWMNECDQAIVSPFARPFVDELKPFALQTLEFLYNIVDNEGNVMDTFPPLFDESGDRGFGGRRLKQFNRSVPEGEHRCVHFLIRHLFAVLRGNPQQPREKINGLFQVLDGYSDMCDGARHGSLFE